MNKRQRRWNQFGDQRPTSSTEPHLFRRTKKMKPNSNRSDELDKFFYDQADAKTPFSPINGNKSQLSLKPYEPPTGKNVLDVWNIAHWVNDKMGHCRLCQEIGEANPTRSQDRDRMFEHTYKRYKKNGWLFEVLRVEDNNTVDIYHIGNGAYSLSSLGASEELKARELKARQTYWKTHEAPRDRIEETKKRAIEHENLMKSIKEKRSKLPPEQQEALAEYEA